MTTNTNAPSDPTVPTGFAPYSSGFSAGADPFSTSLGPLYYRRNGDAHEFMVRIRREHCNLNQVAHGGFMAAMTDVICGSASYYHFKDSAPPLVTVSLHHEFLAGAPVDQWLLGRGTVRQQGKSIMFADCEYFVGDHLVGLARCVMKITGKSKASA